MSFLKKFSLFSISFIFGMAFTSGLMFSKFDQFYYPITNWGIDTVVKKIALSNKKLECNGKTKLSNINIKEFNDSIKEY